MEGVADPEDDGEEMVDNEEDREMDGELYGRRVRAIYDNEWHNGRIAWYNSVLDRHRVEFEYGTEDYIHENNIENVSIVMA